MVKETLRAGFGGAGGFRRIHHFLERRVRKRKAQQLPGFNTVLALQFGIERADLREHVAVVMAHVKQTQFFQGLVRTLNDASESPQGTRSLGADLE